MAENRLSRWSKRKAEAREKVRTRGSAMPLAAEVEPDGDGDVLGRDAGADPLQVPMHENAVVPEPPELPDPTPEELAAEAEAHGLPAPETLDKDSDFSGFMTGKVSEGLKRAALRKLWRSDAVFANLDGLNDYDEDFNVIDTLITAAETNYKVGKGIVSDDEDEPEDITDPNAETSETSNVIASRDGDDPNKKQKDTDSRAGSDPDDDQALEEDNELG